jgi:hypothetical protein
VGSSRYRDYSLATASKLIERDLEVPMMTRAPLLALPLGLAACLGQPDDLETSALDQALRVVPRTDCAALGLGDRERLIPEPTSATYEVDAVNTVRLGFDATGAIFFFQSTIRMDAVLVHAGDQTAVWDFGGESNGWGSLHGPIDPAVGWPPVPEAVSFCFDYELLVNPNAFAKGRRQYGWDVVKQSDTVALTLAAGQTYVASYDVTVTATSVTDSDLRVDGPIFISNRTPYTTTITGVTVMVGEVPAAVTCPVALPSVLGPGGLLTCSYLAEVPDTADRLVVATVTADGELPGESGSEVTSFGKHTTKIDLVDACVDVVDDRVGPLGAVCASEGSRTFQYTMELGPRAVCGPFAFDNTATWIGRTTGATGSSTWTITGEVPCEGGCTLTPGYWRNHSEYGPARYDATWGQLPAGADTPFFLSGGSYLAALSTPVAGNPYWTLARAYAAAELNGLAGASQTAVAASLADAAALLATVTPLDLSRLHGGRDGGLRDQVIALASHLDDYNNGLIGPGHCDE